MSKLLLLKKCKGKTYPKLLVGIDPGKKGSIALVLEEEAGSYILIRIYDMPILRDVKKIKKRDTGKVVTKTKTMYDIDKIVSLFNLVKRIASPSRITCKVEKVHAMPRDGKQGAFNFGYGYGLIIGVIEGLKLTREDITIPSWKSKFGIKDKDDAIRVAREKVSNIDYILEKERKKKLTTDNADSMLIAIT